MSQSRRVLGTVDRLKKIRTMSRAEVATRVRYQASLQLERWRHRRGSGAPSRHLDSLLIPALRGGDWRARLLSSRQNAPATFFRGVQQRDIMRGLFDTVYAAEQRDMLSHAAAARAHRFRFFGREFTYGDDIPWQTDPVTGRAWPRVFHADVPVHGGDIGFGDVKHVWELSRQQCLMDLGKSYFLTGDEASLAAVRDLVRSWVVGNPYGTGVNWSCALEPAFRAQSWLWTYFLTLPGLDEAFHLEWLAAFYDHGHFIERHLEEFSSPYNHLIGEAATLMMLGTCFPEFTSAPRWVRRGRAVLEQRLDEQFYADGGTVEQSTFYHHATLGFYLLAALTVRKAGDDLSSRIWTAIERGLEFSMHLVQPDGRIPEIGGADDGKPIRLEQLPFWDFRPYLAVGAVLFRRGDFKFVATRFFEDALWLLGPEGRVAFDAIEAVVPAAPSVDLPQSGYAILRSDWSRTADYVCVDCGEQAAGMRPDEIANSMHGHADCLSFVAWLGGRRVLVDSGLYAYNCGGTWEAHFRETAAHNTARIDQQNQAYHISKMAWSHSYRVTREGFGCAPDGIWTLGSHDGFARGDTPVTHRRAVWLRPGSCLVIYDEFTGRGTHDFEVNFQFAPGELALIAKDAVRFDGIVDLVWTGTGTWVADVSVGGAEPDSGWIAPSLGILEPAPRLRIRSRQDASRIVLLTVVAARAAAGRGTHLVWVDGAAGPVPMVAVAGDGWTDWIAAPAIAAGGPIESDALVGAARVSEKELIASAHVAGTAVRVDTATLLAAVGGATAAHTSRR